MKIREDGVCVCVCVSLQVNLLKLKLTFFIWGQRCTYLSHSLTDDLFLKGQPWQCMLRRSDRRWTGMCTLQWLHYFPRDQYLILLIHKKNSESLCVFCTSSSTASDLPARCLVHGDLSPSSNCNCHLNAPTCPHCSFLLPWNEKEKHLTAHSL